MLKVNVICACPHCPDPHNVHHKCGKFLAPQQCKSWLGGQPWGVLTLQRIHLVDSMLTCTASTRNLGVIIHPSLALRNHLLVIRRQTLHIIH